MFSELFFGICFDGCAVFRHALGNFRNCHSSVCRAFYCIINTSDKSALSAPVRKPSTVFCCNFNSNNAAEISVIACRSTGTAFTHSWHSPFCVYGIPFRVKEKPPGNPNGQNRISRQPDLNRHPQAPAGAWFSASDVSGCCKLAMWCHQRCPALNGRRSPS